MAENLRKVLITAKVHPFLLEHLAEQGYEVIYLPAITYSEARKKIYDCIGLIVTTRIKVDRAFLENAPKLQWIGRLGSGMETIDVNFAKEKGIRCVSSPEGNCNAVGEQVVGMLLALFANILKSNLQLREGIWEREKNRGIEIMGKTVGIIGYGHTGHAVARKLSGFECEVIAYDKYKKDYGDEFAKQVDMGEIFRRADIVTMHIPLDDFNYHLANDQFFQSFATPIYFVNASRGKVVHTPDLIKNLKSNKLLGVCMDVFENEKPSTFSKEEKEQFEFLLRAENVILTPHIAGYTHEASYKMVSTVLKKLGI